jgi:hypothetical protein
MTELLSNPERPELLPENQEHGHEQVEGPQSHETETAASHEEARAEQAEQLESARETASAEAETGLDPLEQLQAAQDEPDAAPGMPTAISRESRKLTAQRELHRLQRRLPAPARALSKVIHQPGVQAVSEAVGKTVSRPSGLLGGGLVAFLGSGSYLYLAKHIGFQYNYFVSTVLFIIGFGVGLGLELAVWFATKSRRESN